MNPEEIRKCVICKQPLKSIEGEVCHSCSNKYQVDEDAPKVGKMRKKKREE